MVRTPHEISNPTPPCGHDTAMIGIERRDSTDGKTVTPMGIRHGVRGLHDSRKRCDVYGLLEDLVIHVADEVLVGVNNGPHPHGAVWLDPPRRGIDPGETSRIHGVLR
jgi:hypothetical protein